MSTNYILSEHVMASDLFDGCLEKFGVREHVNPDTTTDTSRCLTDGRNYLWVYIDDAGLVSCLSGYGLSTPTKILIAIAEEFDTDIFSEHQPQFWGFDTKEAWDAAMGEMAKAEEEKYYIEVMKYVRGEPHNIPPGTLGMTKAKIAKKLAENDPALLAPENKDQLLHKIEATYNRDQSNKIKLSPARLAFAKMVATNEDDLPRA